MKKVILSIAAAAAMVFTAQAQFSIIPKGGVALSNFAVKEKEDGQRFGLGFAAGLGFNLPLGDGGLSIQPELLYIQKGYGLKSDESIQGINITTTGRYIANVIELPILAKYTFGEDAFKAYVNLGPSFGYLMNAKFKGKVEGGGTSVDFDEDADLDSERDNRLDIGLQAGAGIMYELGPGSLVLDARYGYGFTNYAKTPDGADRADFKSQSRTIAVTIGYAITLGGK